MALPAFDALTGLVDRVFGVVDSLVTDKDQAARLKHELHMTLSKLNLAQIAVNAEEAKHASLFVAGWRPFIGWVCGAALAWQFILAPVLQWGLTLAGLELTYSLPQVASDRLMELVLAMLGMAGLRTYEKRSGVSREKVKRR
ncbi:hypothetical protein JCM17844_03520 [Iodidimonas gelatinilytica]|uniref:Holin of 3TMs, for gene-transfer release n=1 Tax=Iodidimonas gelatinilytica TaxID=1236966 RepID=A0A5A7MNX1_9PROT|nr:3TM-type holin [Iodidimonas gelatinilytica]GEQ96715.1 hypothetical protein JCM17844_03520 [Iodidimonas gelatinilytica]GER01439.1 hypothetical protein JCM17845_20620 [Iodidimonas gelatinilytica]